MKNKWPNMQMMYKNVLINAWKWHCNPKKGMAEWKIKELFKTFKDERKINISLSDILLTDIQAAPLHLHKQQRLIRTFTSLLHIKTYMHHLDLDYKEIKDQVWANSKNSDQTAHLCNLIRVLAVNIGLNKLCLISGRMGYVYL